jgi:hypothetical protein
MGESIMYYVAARVSFLFSEPNSDRPNLMEYSINASTENSDVEPVVREIALNQLATRKFRYTNGVLKADDLLETRVQVETVSLLNFFGEEHITESASRVDYATW